MAAEVLAPTQELRGVLADMRREIEMLRRREAVRESQLLRLKSELDHAARIQRQMTGKLPVLHGAAELTVVAHPADRVNGDFHFAQRTSQTGVTLAVADATGHGLAAGLIAAALQGAMGHAERPSTEVGTLQKLNDQLLSYEFSDCEFVTAVLAEFDEQTRLFRWVRAGGPPPVLIRPGERPKRLMSRGMPLGVEAACELEAAEVQLVAGDLLLLHTDGLEALHTRVTGSQKDEDFLEWVGRRTDSLPATIAQGDHAVKSQRDDITVLALHIDK